MNYNHLYYFYTAARLGGVSKASKALRISQPSLSVQIKNFENQIGKKLFQKVGRTVQLTLDGERAYRYCQKIFEAVNDFEVHLKGTSTAVSKLKIGMSVQIESPFVADLFSRVYNKNQKFRSTLYLASAQQNDLLEQLRSRQIDLVLTNTPIYSSDFQLRADVDMPVGLFISTQRYDQISKTIPKTANLKTWMNESKAGLILPSIQQRLRHETDIYLQKFALKTEVLLETDVLSVVARAIVDGVGLGFLPYPYVAEELKLKLMKPLGAQASYWNHKLYVIARRQETLDPILEEFIKAVQNLEDDSQFLGLKKT
ncbi:MAG: LysR family transcriptional regulator [Bdellovibrio sp.]|nr:LysR family transcriptional regulator [Bdellovibrio sp.]